MRKTLKEELEEYKDNYLRALAELENYKKRARKEKEDLLKCANECFLIELLQVADNFDRCLESLKSHKEKNLDDFYKGVELIYNGLMQFLKQQGVNYFYACGETFNPKFHEAISAKETQARPVANCNRSRPIDEQQPDTQARLVVVEEVSKGYMLNDKVLRPAKVIVSEKPDVNHKQEV